MSEKLPPADLPNGKMYPVPAKHLQGSLAEMLFWDAIFYLLAVKGKTNRYGHRFVEANYAELREIADLSKRTLRKMIDVAMQLDEPYRLCEEEGIRPYSYLLTQKQYQERLAADRTILKPISYIENGWAWAVAQPYPNSSKKSRLPLAVLNVLFRRPHGQSASFQEIVSRCRNKKKPPDPAVVEAAIVHLMQLGLVKKEKSRHFRLVRERFAHNGREILQQMQSQDSSDELLTLTKWAEKTDSKRAALTLEIVQLGQFEIGRHFKEIFYDLASVQYALELDWLRYVVQRKRGYQLSSKNRWRSIWKSYERKLHTEMFSSQSEKVCIDLAQTVKEQVELSLNNHDPDLLRWGKLVVWVNDARYQFCHLQRPETVQISLKRQGKVVCQHQLHCEIDVVRCDLTKDLRLTKHPSYQIVVEVERPLRQFKITLRLEAEYLPQRKR